jgi:hypothetical protein
MGVLDPEYTGKVKKKVDSNLIYDEELEREEEEFYKSKDSGLVKSEEDEASKKLQKQAAKKQLESSSKQDFNRENENKPKSDSKDSAKQLLSGVKTSLDNDSTGGPPPSPLMSGLEAGISSGGNPAAIGGAFLMGVVKSMQYKEQQKQMGEARAKMEEAKGEKEKGAIALRMGDAVSRALGSAGRKRSINI